MSLVPLAAAAMDLQLLGEGRSWFHLKILKISNVTSCRWNAEREGGKATGSKSRRPPSSSNQTTQLIFIDLRQQHSEVYGEKVRRALASTRRLIGRTILRTWGAQSCR